MSKAVLTRSHVSHSGREVYCTRIVCSNAHFYWTRPLVHKSVEADLKCNSNIYFKLLFSEMYFIKQNKNTELTQIITHDTKNTKFTHILKHETKLYLIYPYNYAWNKTYRIYPYTYAWNKTYLIYPNNYAWNKTISNLPIQYRCSNFIILTVYANDIGPCHIHTCNW